MSSEPNPDTPPQGEPEFLPPGQTPTPPPYPGQRVYGPPDQAPAGQQPPVGYPGPQPPHRGVPTKPAASRVPLVIALTAGALVMILTAGFVLVRVVTSLGIGPGSNPTSAALSTDGSAAVKGYLEALASGDAATALSYAVSPPADTTMLTDDVLAAALRDNPLTDIQVTASSNYAPVTASYRLGDRLVSDTFYVMKDGNLWHLANVAATVDLTSISPAKVAARVNGVPVAGNQLVLFPGTYTITLADTRYTTSLTSFMVESPMRTPDTYTIGLQLSDAGRDAVRAAAQAKLTGCLAQRDLQPPGCGFGAQLQDGYTAKASTIRWTVTNGANAMKNLELRVDYSDPTSVSASVAVQLQVDLTSTDGHSWRGYSGIYAVQADLSGDTVAITFGS